MRIKLQIEGMMGGVLTKTQMNQALTEVKYHQPLQMNISRAINFIEYATKTPKITYSDNHGMNQK